MRRAVLAAGIVAAALGCGAGCGPPPGTPHLTALRCATTDACQSLEDPFLLKLAVDFSDTDGDLSGGTYTEWLDQQKLVTDASLADLFKQESIDGAAKAGVLYVDAPLKLANVTSGMSFWVALEVTDGSGKTSNRPGIRFQLDLKQ